MGDSSRHSKGVHQVPFPQREAHMTGPAYHKTYESGELSQRIETLTSMLASCRLCPRACGANRLGGEQGFCRTGRYAVVASYGPHFGEERPLVGRGGSGTIFFTYCNLMCCFCQNYEISHIGEGQEVSSQQLARIMIFLQSAGCHNINFVSPSHVVAQIVEALPHAIEQGLHVPLVFNTGGYDLPGTLKLLDGIIDIYMPDYKFTSADIAKRLAAAPDYPEVVKAAIREMHRQVGDLVLDPSGLAVRGLLVRHLVLPEDAAGTSEAMQWLAREISINTYVNIMDQYRPCGTAFRDPSLGRRITRMEYRDAVQAALRCGLHRLDEKMAF